MAAVNDRYLDIANLNIDDEIKPLVKLLHCYTLLYNAIYKCEREIDNIH